MVDYEDLVPVAWRSLSKPSSASDSSPALPFFSEQALAVLHAVGALEDGQAERLKEEQPELHQELARLDAKLQLLIDMVAHLVRDATTLPEPCVIHLSPDHARVRLAASAAASMVEGERGELSVFIHPAVAMPLTLPGRVVGLPVEPDQPWLEIQFDPLDPALREALGRHVFRRHRRMVAAARRQSSVSSA